MDATAPKQLRDHNLVITVEDEDVADRVIERLADAGVPQDELVVDAEGDRGGALRRAAYAEEDRMMAGPAVPATGPMVKGAAMGILIGSVLGGLLFLPVAALPFSDMEWAVRLVVTGLTGAVAGGAAGAVYFGSRVAEVEEEGEVLASEQGVVVAVHSDDPETAIRAEEVASTFEPLRIDWIDRTRQPVSARDMPFRDRGTTTLR